MLKKFGLDTLVQKRRCQERMRAQESVKVT